MRKYKMCISSILLFCLLIGLTACGGKKTAVKKNTTEEDIKNAEELLLGSANEQEDVAKFSLYNIETTDAIEPQMLSDYSTEYEATTGKMYIDVIFDYCNLGSKAVGSEKAMKVSAIDKDDHSYKANLYAVEMKNESDLLTYEEITPLTECKLHCGIEVPKGENNYDILVKVGDVFYLYEDYKYGDSFAKSKKIGIGETLEAEDFATVTFNGAEYSDELLPSNTSDYYSYYSIDNNDNTYLIVKFNVTNKTSSSKDIGAFVSVRAKYQEKYKYSGYAVTESDDGTSMEAYESIDSLNSKDVYYLVEVPKSLTGETAAISITFDGEQYSFSL